MLTLTNFNNWRNLYSLYIQHIINMSAKELWHNTSLHGRFDNLVVNNFNKKHKNKLLISDCKIRFCPPEVTIFLFD